MPVTYQLHPEAGLVETRCPGDVAFEEMLAHFETLAADPALPARLDVLLDLDETTSLPESDQMRAVAEAAGRLAGQVEWGACAVVCSEDAMFGMARVFGVFAERHYERVGVFRTHAEARAWLARTRADAG